MPERRRKHYCNGFADSSGFWNTGFYCPQWGDEFQEYCCGAENERKCCPEPKDRSRTAAKEHRSLVADSKRRTSAGHTGSEIHFSGVGRPWNTPETLLPVEEPTNPNVAALVIPAALGVSVLLFLLILVLVLCFFCSCCSIYKKRQRNKKQETVCDENRCQNCGKSRQFGLMDSSGTRYLRPCTNSGCLIDSEPIWATDVADVADVADALENPPPYCEPELAQVARSVSIYTTLDRPSSSVAGGSLHTLTREPRRPPVPAGSNILEMASALASDLAYQLASDSERTATPSHSAGRSSRWSAATSSGGHTSYDIGRFSPVAPWTPEVADTVVPEITNWTAPEVVMTREPEPRVATIPNNFS